MSRPRGMKDAKQPAGPPVDLGNGWKMYTILGHKLEVPNHYNVTKSVGYGAYGFVVAAVDARTMKKVAIKKCHNVFRDVGDCKRVLREIKLLQFLKHENILSLSSLFTAGSKETFADIYLVMELMDTDLNTVIRSKQKMADDHFKYFIYQVLRGLKFIHSANVLHRDIKPANLLVNINCDLKFCDFGLARGYDAEANSSAEDVTRQKQELTDYVVTRWYRPPELLLMSTTYTSAVDIWSTGCLFCEMINRKPLFPGKDYLEQLSRICDVLGVPCEDDVKYLRNREAANYVVRLPRREPKLMEEIVPGMTDPQGLDFLNKMLVFDPKKRWSAAELLGHPYLETLHDPSDEPACDCVFTWPYDADETINREQLRELFWKEVELYLPGEQSPVMESNNPASQPNTEAVEVDAVVETGAPQEA